MVLVFSSHSNDSLQVLREVERAASKSLPIVPFRTENLSPAPAFEFFLSVPHWLDAFPPPADQHFQKLLDAIKRFLSSPTRQQSKDPSKEGISDGDQRILDTMSMLLSVFGANYSTATASDKAQIEKEVIDQFSALRAKWKMPPRVFELYIKICLEEKRVLHTLEFIRNCMTYIERYPDYQHDVTGWILQNSIS
jgi:hypothetical protein